MTPRIGIASFWNCEPVDRGLQQIAIQAVVHLLGRRAVARRRSTPRRAQALLQVGVAGVDRRRRIVGPARRSAPGYPNAVAVSGYWVIQYFQSSSSWAWNALMGVGPASREHPAANTVSNVSVMAGDDRGAHAAHSRTGRAALPVHVVTPSCRRDRLPPDEPAPVRPVGSVLSGCLSLHAERLPIRTYTTADDLGHNTVNRIVRDSRGLLWFCTAGGLSRFDGYTFTNFGVDRDCRTRRSTICWRRAAATIG